MHLPLDYPSGAPPAPVILAPGLPEASHAALALELHTLHEQLETTQQLYGKVRDGRDMLREELGEMKAEMSLYHKSVQAGIKVVEKGPSSSSASLSESRPARGDGEDDSKVDSPNSGKSEDSFTIDEIRAEFEGFDGF